jgi:hypothetical protein
MPKVKTETFPLRIKIKLRSLLNCIGFFNQHATKNSSIIEKEETKLLLLPENNCQYRKFNITCR